MASSGGPPFPRDGWSDPQAEKEQVERTQRRLDQVEAQAGQGPPALADDPPPPSMVTLYGAPPIQSAPAYGAPPFAMAPAYGGPMRWQATRSRKPALWLGISGSLVGLGLCAALHLGALWIWALGGGVLGLVAGLLFCASSRR